MFASFCLDLQEGTSLHLSDRDRACLHNADHRTWTLWWKLLAGSQHLQTWNNLKLSEHFLDLMIALCLAAKILDIEAKLY